MGQDPGQGQSQLTDDQKSPEELRAEIEEVREDLGDTAAALAAKTDFKTRAREKADELKRTAAGKKDELLSKAGPPPSDGTSAGPGALTRARTTARQNPVLVAAVGALIGGFAIGRLTRRGE
jgi:hypothetical protein